MQVELSIPINLINSDPSHPAALAIRTRKRNQLQHWLMRHYHTHWREDSKPGYVVFTTNVNEFDNIAFVAYLRSLEWFLSYSSSLRILQSDTWREIKFI